LDEECPVGMAIILFGFEWYKNKYNIFYDIYNKSIFFLFNSQKINFWDQRPIKDLFGFSSFPKILVEFLDWGNAEIIN
jgi:hypothetical protein